MGVRCPNVRQIIYLGVPDDVSSYIQETGRAGRMARHQWLPCYSLDPTTKWIIGTVAHVVEDAHRTRWRESFGQRGPGRARVQGPGTAEFYGR